jgi:serine/threonine protein phosphatase PrpC
MKLISFGKTDQGKMRANNEDAFLVNDRLGLYAVADGIGGHEGGEVASRLAVDALSDMLREQFEGSRSAVAFDDSPEADQYISSLRGAVALANTTVRQAAAQDPSLTGMGTTVTAVLLRPRTSVFVHVGDSRAYMFRNGILRQLTNDHSLVAEQMRAGLITPEQARMSPYRHVITRSVGIHPEVHADFGMFELEKNDILLLCTDGLTEMIKDDDIARILSNAIPVASAESLIRRANDNGGVDNITVVVVRIEDV